MCVCMPHLFREKERRDYVITYSLSLSLSFSLSFSFYSYATAGEDYNPVSGSVVFAPNQTMATFTVTIIDDTVPEIPEIFYIILLNATLLSGDSNHLGSDGK